MQSTRSPHSHVCGRKAALAESAQVGAQFNHNEQTVIFEEGELESGYSKHVTNPLLFCCPHCEVVVSRGQSANTDPVETLSSQRVLDLDPPPRVRGEIPTTTRKPELRVERYRFLKIA